MVLEDFKEVLGTSASVCQIIQFFSGILVCRKFMKKGSSDDVSGIPFICGFLSCGLWSGYAKLLNDFILIYINVLGSFLMFSYVCVFYIYSSKRSKLIKQILIVIAFLVFIQTHIKSLEDFELKRKHLGIVCSFVTISFFASPLTDLARVIRVKSAESLPFPLILMSTIVSFQWTLYGYVIKDGFVMYLNLAGFCLSLFQLLLFCVYPARWMNDKSNITIVIPEHRIKIAS
ncbi:unnamed protein product [Nezara viridula]|uniref:Sugar transporter SWEET n=1 Tax=Nezara viridula TaxID=85310 RepID=A0A9P0MMX2_NEZVI|nr:unnamed protein product [Nezara viridula]